MIRRAPLLVVVVALAAGCMPRVVPETGPRTLRERFHLTAEILTPETAGDAGTCLAIPLPLAVTKAQDGGGSVAVKYSLRILDSDGTHRSNVVAHYRLQHRSDDDPTLKDACAALRADPLALATGGKDDPVRKMRAELKRRSAIDLRAQLEQRRDELARRRAELQQLIDKIAGQPDGGVEPEQLEAPQAPQQDQQGAAPDTPPAADAPPPAPQRLAMGQLQQDVYQLQGSALRAQLDALTAEQQALDAELAKLSPPDDKPVDSEANLEQRLTAELAKRRAELELDDGGETEDLVLLVATESGHKVRYGNILQLQLAVAPAGKRQLSPTEFTALELRLINGAGWWGVPIGTVLITAFLMVSAI